MNREDTFVLFDTCVLLKPRMSDVIMDLRAEDVMSVHWTEAIDEEFLKNAVEQFQVSPTAAERRLRAFKRRCPEWQVFFTDVHEATVPDAVDLKDRHVAAAALALRTYAEDQSTQVLLVTDNIKDFAKEEMQGLGIQVLRSGDFLNMAFRAEPRTVERAIDQVVLDLKAPPYTLAELLFALREQGANEVVDALAATRGVTPKRKHQLGS